MVSIIRDKARKKGLRLTKNVKGKRKDGTPYLKQYKWRCTFRDAYQVCLLIWPFAHVKLDKIQQIIEYYSDKKIMNGNVVSLQEYKQLAKILINFKLIRHDGSDALSKLVRKTALSGNKKRQKNTCSILKNVYYRRILLITHCLS